MYTRPPPQYLPLGNFFVNKRGYTDERAEWVVAILFDCYESSKFELSVNFGDAGRDDRIEVYSLSLLPRSLF